MMGRTHMMLGALTGALLESQAPGLGVLEGILIGAIGGLVPDLDHPNSKATRSIAPIALGGSRRNSMVLMSLGVMALAWQGHLPYDGVMAIACWLLVAALSKHRGITHSLIGLLSATYAVHTWLGASWIIFAVGYASHLFADMLTDRGVPLLWPLQLDFSIPTGFSTGRFWSTFVEKWIQMGCILYIGWILVPHLEQLLRLAEAQLLTTF
ncbi:metal-dependent hydrolase [Tumebacillus permanentifrigoris]|uniref:Inner membrane protein n=1 Tax=Tumebacillus permanentifrigoris TaxID=378543 RepID=A0A316DSZ0_9BACL|nr:metal-dependent hydrolase [Tumebacillus permanentifrigoris]PWK09649.1 inner membrane protein [Tumebacillus permanentifrigoris]